MYVYKIKDHLLKTEFLYLDVIDNYAMGSSYKMYKVLTTIINPFLFICLIVYIEFYTNFFLLRMVFLLHTIFFLYNINLFMCFKLPYFPALRGCPNKS